MKLLLITIISLLFSYHSISQNAKLTLQIKNIEEPKGEICIGIYQTEADYKASENQSWKGCIPVDSLDLEFVIEDLPIGTYAISLIHDVNKNGELDTNWIGMPKEPFGFSNDAKARMGPPKFDDAKIEFNGDMNTTITLMSL